MQKIAIFLLIFILSGCATPYTESGLMGGYEDIDLGNGRFKVTFLGNGYIKDSKVPQHTARRAKELCKGSYKVLEEIFEGQGLLGKPRHTLVVQCN